MTENEQLKHNTEMAYAKQRAQAISDYLDKLTTDSLAALDWKLRADGLEFFTLSMYLLGVIFTSVWNTPEEVVDFMVQAFILVIWGVMIRAWYFHSKWRYAEGEYDGFINTMKIMGYLPEDLGNDRKRRVVKRKSLFSRFKELFERVGEGKTKESYA